VARGGVSDNSKFAHANHLAICDDLIEAGEPAGISLANAYGKSCISKGIDCADVVVMTVGLNHAPHIQQFAHLEKAVGLCGSVDKKGLSGLCALKDVDVVLEISHDNMEYPRVVKLVRCLQLDSSPGL
jgi:hypothetical protein